MYSLCSFATLSFIYKCFERIIGFAALAIIYYSVRSDPTVASVTNHTRRKSPQRRGAATAHRSAATHCTHSVSESDESTAYGSPKGRIRGHSKARRMATAVKKSPKKVVKGCRSLAKGVSGKVQDLKNAQRARTLGKALDYLQQDMETMDEEDRQATGLVGKIREYNNDRKNRILASYIENDMSDFYE